MRDPLLARYLEYDPWPWSDLRQQAYGIVQRWIKRDDCKGDDGARVLRLLDAAMEFCEANQQRLDEAEAKLKAMQRELAAVTDRLETALAHLEDGGRCAQWYRNRIDELEAKIAAIKLPRELKGIKRHICDRCREAYDGD